MALAELSVMARGISPVLEPVFYHGEDRFRLPRLRICSTLALWPSSWRSLIAMTLDHRLKPCPAPCGLIAPIPQ